MRPIWWNEAQNHLVDVEPKFIALLEHASTIPWRDPGRPFSSLARAVIGQQISVSAAASVWEKILALSQSSNEIPPSPMSIRALPHQALRECGVSLRKSEYLHALAEYFLNPDFSEVQFLKMGDEEILAELTSIRGVGRWTGEMFLMFHLHRPDVLPIGDLGLRTAAGRLFGNGTAMPAPEVKILAQPWRPFATAATWLLWRSTSVPVTII